MPTSTVIVVVGASGGLGASTLALAVGRRLAATGPPCVVVDLDLARGGLDVAAGIEHLPGRRWSSFGSVRGAVPGDLLVASLPGEDGCRVLSAGPGAAEDPPAVAVTDVLASVRSGSARVVLDVPAGSPHLAAALSGASHGLVLSGLRTRALADGDALTGRLLGDEPVAADLRLVTRGPVPSEAVLDDVVAHLGLGHLGHLADDPRVARDAERGLWPGTGRDAVRRCADHVVQLVDAVSGARAS